MHHVEGNIYASAHLSEKVLMSIKNDPIEEEWMEQTILNEAKRLSRKASKYVGMD